MANKKFLLGISTAMLVFGFIVAGCATIPKEPTILEGYWRFTTTAGGAEGQAIVDEAMENVGQFFVFNGNTYYKGMGVLPHEKGTFTIEGSSIELEPTHMNTGIASNKLSWSKIGLMMKAVYPEKTLPYTLSGDILKVVDIGIQQSFKKVDPFFTIDKKGNLEFQFK
ncbi:MAG: hypothetical protein LBP80_04210 [Treponema sp.]|jgi:hypothetical protein|nr:hypothetical protein [Treponema sp.]